MAKPDKKAKSNGKRPLTAKQALFCYEYLFDFNASAAALRAKYSPKTAFRSGQENMQKPAIQNEIARLQLELVEKAKENGEIVSPEEILLGYTRDIRFDPALLYKDDKKTLIPIPDLPREVRMSLCGAKYNARGDLEYKYPDKNRVRDLAGKLMGLTNGNADAVRDVLQQILGIQINVNIGDSAIAADLPGIIELAKTLAGSKMKQVGLPPVEKVDSEPVHDII